MRFVESGLLEAAALFDLISKIAILSAFALALITYLLSKFYTSKSKKLKKIATNNVLLGIALFFLALLLPFVIAVFTPSPGTAEIDRILQTAYNLFSGSLVALLVLSNTYWLWSGFLTKKVPEKEKKAESSLQ